MAARVQAGGHDIPEAKIRARYAQSHRNLLTLMPYLTQLNIYDNSVQASPLAGQKPNPLMVLHIERGKVKAHCELDKTPGWAKPFLGGALGPASKPHLRIVK